MSNGLCRDQVVWSYRKFHISLKRTREWMVRQFHRSSSAVEGSNGRLSQMYHNRRGLTKKRLAALTVVHNYGLKRIDGTTAADCPFGSPFQDVFEWLISQMGDLPLPRKPRDLIKRNPLILQFVPPKMGSPKIQPQFIAISEDVLNFRMPKPRLSPWQRDGFCHAQP